MSEATATSAVSGPTVAFKVDGLEIVFRRPTQDQWDLHQKRISNPKNTKSALIRELCQKCLVSPALEAFQAVFAKKPAYPTRMASAIADLAGKSQQVEVTDDAVAVEIGGKRLTFHVPSLEVWEDFQEQLTKGGSGVERERELCIRCCDQPDALPALFEQWPALHDPISDGLCEIAGVGIEGEVKKG